MISTMDINRLRRFVFSKEPNVMSLESLQDTVRIAMKNNETLAGGDHTIGFKGHTFIVSANNETLITSHCNVESGDVVFETGAIKSKAINCPSIILQEYKQPNEVIVKGLSSHISGIQYQVPSRFHQHRFVARVGSNQTNEWMRIQSRAQGGAQVGIGTTLCNRNATLHVAGQLYCDGLMMRSEADSNVYIPYTPNRSEHSFTSPSCNITFLDETGKIPSQYLPTVYKTTLLQNDVGVGIGTKVPVQTMHIEGGCYISGKFGVGTTQPSGVAHIENTSSTLPCLIVQSSTEGDVFQALGQSVGKLFVIKSTGEVGISGPSIMGYSCAVHGNLFSEHVETSNMRTGSLFVGDDEKCYIRAQVIGDDGQFSCEWNTPANFNEYIECSDIRSIVPIVITAPSVETTCIAVNTIKMNIRSENDVNDGKNTLNLIEIMKSLSPVHSYLHDNNSIEQTLNEWEKVDPMLKRVFIEDTTNATANATLNNGNLTMLMWEVIQSLWTRVGELENKLNS